MKLFRSKKRKTFVQWFIAIFTIIFVTAAGTISGIKSVYAATVNGTLNNVSSYLSCTYTYDNTNNSSTCSYSNGTITMVAKTYVKSGCTSTSYESKTITLNIQNSSSNKGILTFDYTISGAGSVTLNGTTK